MDTKLDRKVALKILPVEVAAHPDRMKRFVQEAKTASALNHPNIITIYEIDETDSGHFIATEFIDGETLRECQAKAPLKLAESLEIAAQIAGALSAAHAAAPAERRDKATLSPRLPGSTLRSMMGHRFLDCRPWLMAAQTRSALPQRQDLRRARRDAASARSDENARPAAWFSGQPL